MVADGGRSDEVYAGHVTIASHLLIASDQRLWAIDRRTNEKLCVSWDEISHFGLHDRDKMRITVFSQTGLKSNLFVLGDSADFHALYTLLAMQVEKMVSADTFRFLFDVCVYVRGWVCGCVCTHKELLLFVLLLQQERG